jgi:hypothetical protein
MAWKHPPIASCNDAPGVELDQAADGLHDAVLGGEDVLHEGVHGG